MQLPAQVVNSSLFSNAIDIFIHPVSFSNENERSEVCVFNIFVDVSRVLTFSMFLSRKDGFKKDLQKSGSVVIRTFSQQLFLQSRVWLLIS